ncbi:hypothetical protein AMECASPLE_037222, partial [Ameca splendens]
YLHLVITPVIYHLITCLSFPLFSIAFPLCIYSPVPLVPRRFSLFSSCYVPAFYLLFSCLLVPVMSKDDLKAIGIHFFSSVPMGHWKNHTTNNG